MLPPLNQTVDLNITDQYNEDITIYCGDSDRTVFFWYWFYTDLVCSLLSFTGNFLVILVLIKNPKLRTTLNFLLLNMSISDILYPFLSLLGVTFVELGLGGAVNKTSGWFLCNFAPFFLNVSATVSVQSLVVIAVHRCYAVTFPLRARLGKKTHVFAVIFAVWVVAVSVFAANLYYYTSSNEEGFPVCLYTLEGKWLEVYDIFVSVLLRTFPFITMSIIYPLIIRTLKRQHVPGNSVSSLAKRNKQNLKLTKMCLMIVFLFFCCWGIYEILFITARYVNSKYVCSLNTAMDVVYPFPSVGAAINPLVYFIYCRNFRQALKNLFKKHGCHSSCKGHTEREMLELRSIKNTHKASGEA